ncbi:hypothetical protein CKAN_01894700 [Cinnamomum micranthum f. kanehirae]|uniref:Uncharacterized protein n=1 Tax=Cinnamomum micranthum f. kanehirae TaxID=337451 RepID=A0A3S3MU91_9MAGN|nr:hypothetical protein CKAN_01894700 [Cinnamomum micranthum f. kanehirae]
MVRLCPRDYRLELRNEVACMLLLTTGGNTRVRPIRPGIDPQATVRVQIYYTDRKMNRQTHLDHFCNLRK